MEKKIIFLDIDGTLISGKRPSIKKEVIEGLKQVRKKGIQLFIASGRHMLELEELKLVEQFEFDGYLLLNGGYCIIDSQIIYDNKIPQEDLKEIIKNTKHVKVTKWHDYAYDIVPKTGGKAAAIQAVSKHFGYQKEELMALGDGHNDIEMLDVVGYPIVMENGSDEVKQHACYICDDVEKEGILKGLKHFNLID